MTEVIRPRVVDDAAIISSTIAEDEAPAWGSGTTYAKDALVVHDHRVWKSAQAANTGHVPGTDNAWWADAGITNYWAMFDQATGTRATAPTEIVVELATSQIDTLVLLDLDAETVRVEMTVGGGPVFDQTQRTSIGGSSIDNWYSWFFEPIGRRDTLIFRLPPYSNGRVKVTISAITTGVPVSCGTLFIGSSLDLGSAELGVKAGITSYSKADTDQFGAVTLVKRSSAKRNTARMIIPADRADTVFSALEELDAVVAVWIVTGRFDLTIIYGWYKDCEVDLALPDNSYVSLTIQGLA